MGSSIIFDCGEAGWALYHRAHLQWRHDQGEVPPDVIVWTLSDRVRFYEGDLAKIVRSDLPNELLSPFLVRNNWFYNNGPDLKEMLAKCNINPKDLIHNFKNLEVYQNKMVFKPFVVHDYELKNYEYMMMHIDRNLPNLVLMPRAKFGAPFTEFRNWGHERWIKLYDMLLANLTEYNIIVCGKLGQVYRLGFDKKRAMHIIEEDPLDKILWVLNDPQTTLVVSSQSFGGKLALLQNVDTLMWGHEKQRHQVDENWSSDPDVRCHFIEDMTYSLSPEVIYQKITSILYD